MGDPKGSGSQASVAGSAPNAGGVLGMVNKAIPGLKNEATDAAWRVAGGQFLKLTREPLVALLSRHLAPDDDNIRLRIAAFLETDLGASLLAALLSVGLSATRGMSGAEVQVVQKMERELRVRSMAGTADVVADVLMGPLRKVMALYLQGVELPELPQSDQTELLDAANTVPDIVSQLSDADLATELERRQLARKNSPTG